MLIALYSVLRILFYFLNRQLFLHSGLIDIILACFNGLRYDLAAIALINLLPYLIVMLPIGIFEKPRTIVLGSFFTVVNGFALSLNVIDLEYFRFTGKRLTADNFLLARDIGDQTTQIALYYWYFSLLMIAFYAILGYLSVRVYRTPSRRELRARWPVWGRMGEFTLVALLGALAIRGGWQAKPLIPANAFSMNPELGALVLNSTFTILKSSDKEAVVELHDLSTDSVKKTLLTELDSSSSPLPPVWPKPKNVVVVILESFGSEYVFPPHEGAGYAPFLKSLTARGSYFGNAYANGRRSIDALPALFAGIPEWMEPPFITSPYQTNKIVGAPEVFASHGYDTVFYHGGNNGTMFFDVMTKRLGFNEYIGADQYPDKKDYDGKWGVFDEPFLQFVAKDLSKKPRPFFAALFTLSSHHPYTIPAEHTGRFPKGTLEIHESLGYSDLALKRFYETAEQEPWFKDTLFVFTADHTSKQEFPENDTIPGRFHVPLLFIMNNKPLPFTTAATSAAVQHADVAATLLDLERLQPTESSHFGESLCRLEKRPGIVLFESDGYHLVGRDFGLSWWLDGRTLQFPILNSDKKTEMSPSELQNKELFLKAIAHYYNNGMVRNQLIW